jgi:hypothetical protein
MRQNVERKSAEAEKITHCSGRLLPSAKKQLERSEVRFNSSATERRHV